MMLQADSQRTRRQYVALEKQGMDSYTRRVKSYQRWWEDISQLEVIWNHPARRPLPAFPVTAGKAIMWLD
jgi:hypothetical protein